MHVAKTAKLSSWSKCADVKNIQEAVFARSTKLRLQTPILMNTTPHHTTPHHTTPRLSIFTASTSKPANVFVVIVFTLSAATIAFGSGIAPEIEGVLVDRVIQDSNAARIHGISAVTARAASHESDVLGATNPAWKNSVLLGKNGLVNQLVLKVADESALLRGLVSGVTTLSVNANRYALERAFVLAVDSSARKPTGQGEALLGALGRPNAARFLITELRQSDDSRSRLSQLVNDSKSDAGPLESLHRLIVLQYDTVDAATRALEQLSDLRNMLVESVHQDFAMEQSATPADIYFSPPSVTPNARNYQWGMHAMNFQGAWDRTRGGGYVGIADSPMWGGPSFSTVSRNDFVPQNADLAMNFRQQFAFLTGYATGLNNYHSQHVGGIVAARSSLSSLSPNDTVGTTGGCPDCSVMNVGGVGTTGTSSKLAQAITQLSQMGAQVINLSANASSPQLTCQASPSTNSMCAAISLAQSRAGVRHGDGRPMGRIARLCKAARPQSANALRR
jgi:Subtilase family